MKELHIKFTISELNLILESLGNLSYIRVYELINKIQHQAKEQLNGSPAGIQPDQKDEEAAAKVELYSN